MDIIMPIVGIVLVLGIAGGIIASRYKVADSTQAIIITGKSKKPLTSTTVDSAGKEHHTSNTDLSGQKVVIGGGAFVMPLVQTHRMISLKSQPIEVKITGVPSADGILLDVDGVVIIKVGGSQESVRLAAQRFGSDQNQISIQTIDTMSGALRGIVGKMTVRDIISDRKMFAQEAVEAAQDTLTNQGLVLDTFQIRNISDREDYLLNLGRPESARVEKIANIAEAEANQESDLKLKKVEETLADAQRALDLKVAGIKIETDTAQATAEASKPLEQAAQKQLILAEMMKIEQANAEVMERKLEAEVRKVADAERYRLEQAAEASKTSAILESEARKATSIAQAEAKAQQDALIGQGQIALAKAQSESRKQEAIGIEAIATAEAGAIRSKGLAEADSIRSKGLAEAESMEKKAEAYENYGDAAILETMAKVLPEIAKPFAEAYSGISNLTIIDSDGTAKLGSSMANNIAQVQEAVKATTGFDLSGFMENFTKPSDKNVVEGTVINDN